MYLFPCDELDDAFARGQHRPLFALGLFSPKNRVCKDA